MKFLLLLISVSALCITYSQKDYKAFKKEIPVKGIKELYPVEGTNNLYYYKSKKENGIWDSRNKAVVAKGIEKYELFEQDPNWIYISIGSKHIYYKWIGDGKKITSGKALKIYPSSRESLYLLHNDELFGVFSKQQGEFYVQPHNSTQDVDFYKIEDTLSWGEISYTSLAYDADTKGFYLSSYLGDGVYGGWSYNIMNGFLHESSDGYQNQSRVTHAQTGDVVYEGDGTVAEWDKGYYVSTYMSYAFFDDQFKPLIEMTREGNFTNKHFEVLVGNSVIFSEQLDRSKYIVENDNGTFIYDISSAKKITSDYDGIYNAGKDVLTSRYYVFLVNNGKVGYYHTNGFLLEPKYESVQLRKFEDGTFGIKADNELYTFVRKDHFNEYYASYGDTLQWSEAFEDKSAIYHHVTIKEGKYLIVSLRRCEPDTHDAAFYTATSYEDGSGVYDLKNERWILRNYHYINPFQDIYIATKAGSSYRNWLKAELYDENFNLISKDEFSSPFIYQGKLILKNKKYDLVEYDCTNRKVKRTIGDGVSPYSDFMYYNGHVFMGSANYDNNRDEYYAGFDIRGVLTPEWKVISEKEFGFYEMLADGLIVLGKYVDESGYGRNWQGYPLEPKELAIMDIYAGKIISNRFYSTVRYFDDDQMVYLEWKDSGERKNKQVKLEELRDFLKNH